MRMTAIISLFLTAVAISAQDTQPNRQSTPSLLKKAKSVLAKIDGIAAIPGLKQPVEILRDRWGVPHIYARNADDLFFAQGFVAAQDRLFQLDLWRRVAVGETAEIFGEQALQGDRFARLMRYRGDMDAEWKSYSPDTERIVTAFTKGVNAYIDHIGDRLPVEFQLLKFRPKKWHPKDVLGRMSGIIMCRNFRREVMRANLIAAVGLEKARRLAPTDPKTQFAPPKGLDLDGIGLDVLSGYYAATKPLQFTPTTLESNNWVVSGARSATGKPLLASDPHRSIALPSLRYLVHLNAPGWNVIGSGEPALPGVAIGHNERIAWGFTIVCTDQTDIFVETLNPKNHDQYKVGDQWQSVRKETELVRVKGRNEPVKIVLRFTRHGPIIHQDNKRHRAFALKWVGSEPGTAAYLGSLALGRARNKAEFLSAMKAWKLPNENIVYADKDGNIGWVAAALTPVRSGYDGLLPSPGNAGLAWERFLSVGELPQSFNPKSGFLATSNQNILPPGYKHLIALDWAPGFRFARVQQRLTAKKKFTISDFKSMQQDAMSLPGQALVRLAKKVDMRNPQLGKLADIVRRWDGMLSVDAQAGPLHAAWMKELEKDFFEAHMPKALHSELRYLANVKLMLQALENPTPEWFGKSPIAERDRLLRATFSRAVEAVKKRLGDDTAKWIWGAMHTVTFHHPLAAMGPEYAKAFNVGPAPRPGDALTPNNTRFNANFEQIHGATYRHVMDLADWDNGWATSAPGQSGQLGSPYYSDLFPMWAKGEYFPLAYSRKKVESVTRHRLQLMPAAK